MQEEFASANQLVLDHEPLARRVAYQFRSAHTEHEDRCQAARLGLVEASRSFDPSVSPYFGPYARKFAVGRASRVRLGVDRYLAVCAAEAEFASIDPRPREPEKDPTKAVETFVSSLPNREQQFTREVFWNDRSPAEASRMLGFSRARGHAIMRSVIRKGRRALREWESLGRAH
jgi:RNA polymerase sigma factor (sigma-70 family)